MKLMLNKLVVIAILVALTACATEQSSESNLQSQASIEVQLPSDFESYTLAQKVQFHIQNDQYNDALGLLNGLDAEDSEIKELKIAAHMTYALSLTYGSLTEMRTRMPEALRHYRRVLELDPGNAQAKAEIEQIEGIYRSLNREIPTGVAE
jgi:Flp pilus assembly protein TadD